MRPSHHLSLLLQHFGYLSTVLQGHKLTVSDFPQVNVPVGREGYNNLLSCGPHQEEQGAHGRCSHLSLGLPFLRALEVQFSPSPWHKGLFSLTAAVCQTTVPGWLIEVPKWVTVMWAWQIQWAASNQLQPSKAAPCPWETPTLPLLGLWHDDRVRSIAKAYITSKEKTSIKTKTKTLVKLNYS